MRNPPATVEAFVTEASNIERALVAGASHYTRLPGVAGPTPSICDIGTSIPNFREIIREVVREELRKLLPAAERPASLSVAEVVRDKYSGPSSRNLSSMRLLPRNRP